MSTALRPYLTTGIALVGASVIAIAPVTVPPPELPAAPTAAARTVTADVEFTALLDDLVAAVQQSVTETIKLYTQSLPADAAALVSAGRFAHLAVLAVSTAYLTPLTIIAPFAVGIMQALPKPLGTLDGVINEALKVIVQTPAVTGISILSLFASIIDDGLSPFDAFVGSFGYLTQAVTTTVQSLQKIVDLFAGALPIADLAPPPPAQARQAVPAESDVTNDVAAAAFSSDADARTVTIAVDDEPAAEPAAPPTDVDDDVSQVDEPEDGTDETTPNGGTDLSDGNQVEPGEVGDDPVADAGSDVPTSEDTAPEAPTADASESATDGSEQQDSDTDTEPAE